ncbi:MurR/RpiR family transcriptional regulator [Diaphorobacter sp. HDW4A]|uniref:MurR/RpiR family transcriptional regulator n=1 Tax=Diaphorobacter sp. HDW4A TaxID=2714924 RepID=UPI00140D7430|nr:MurR/RpiR family transcriptional regulator [Diaphorobacter sp. HDW4A]QIL82609.1 MurR/RpiR family transcriptional regulator [Diaphorobacter sp. HDW4A]
MSAAAASPSPSSLSFLGQIRQLMDTLPPSERRLGEFILDFPGDLASYNASELAELVGVSNATVTRFTRRLGYAGYEEARRHAREERSRGSPLFVAWPDAGGDASGFVAEHIQQACENMAATFSQIDEALIDEIANAICAARSVLFLGYRNNRNFAAYLRWQLAQLLSGTQVIPGAGETLAEYAVDTGEKTVLVVFALRRSLPIAARFAASAARAGAQVVYVTDQLSGAANVPARWVLRCHSAAPGPLDNHVAAIMLCDLIATRVMRRAGAAGRRRLTTVEAEHDSLSELKL